MKGNQSKAWGVPSNMIKMIQSKVRNLATDKVAGLENDGMAIHMTKII